MNETSMPAETKQELTNTLSGVAKMKAEFDLLKRVIISSIELDYSGTGLMLKDGKLLIETMKVIEPSRMEQIFEELKIIQHAREMEETKNG